MMLMTTNAQAVISLAVSLCRLYMYAQYVVVRITGTAGGKLFVVLSHQFDLEKRERLFNWISI